MSDGKPIDPLTIAGRVETLTRIMDVAAEQGKLEGNVEAYRDVCDAIDRALAECEEELTRESDSKIVLGQVMALTKLAAHFAPAPAYYQRRMIEHVGGARETLDTIFAKLRETGRATD